MTGKTLVLQTARQGLRTLQSLKVSQANNHAEHQSLLLLLAAWPRRRTC